MKSRKIIFSIFFALLLALGGIIAKPFLFKGKPGGASAQASGGGKSKSGENETVFSIITAKAQTGSIYSYLILPGNVETVSSVEVFSDTEGILARVHAELGQYVRANQLLAEIDPSKPGTKYAMSPVRAKVAGTITAFNFNQGSKITPQVPIASIGNLDALRVVTAVPEAYSAHIKRGMAAEMEFEAWPNASIPMKIDFVSPVVDAVSRSLTIKFNVPDGYEFMKPGMYADIKLTTQKKDAVVKIPLDSLVRRMNEIFVYVVEDDTAVKRPVKPGIIQDIQVEIAEGLSTGETIVYQGQNLLEDGSKVRIIKNEEFNGE
ncbi:MAG: hypothetical protein B0D92_03505 [Spirochaeta sp. LUC14_002_19_P3]|nr:MAG: hypothetical protein B0D92_03505 [Spirochaeta sp. LUC14_002_19_P3]